MLASCYCNLGAATMRRIRHAAVAVDFATTTAAVCLCDALFEAAAPRTAAPVVCFFLILRPPALFHLLFTVHYGLGSIREEATECQKVTPSSKDLKKDKIN